MKIGKDYEVSIPGSEQMEQREQEMIQKIAERIITLLDDLKQPATIIEIEEFNRTEFKVSWRMILAKLAEGSNCSELGLMAAHNSLLFETGGVQNYEATNHDNATENYDGTIKVRVKLPAVYDSERQCHGPNEETAYKILRQAYMVYYEEILRYYPEWTTKYLNAPIYVSLPLEHV